MDLKNLIKISFEDWCSEYQPIINHIDPNASFDDGEGGVMFETYGAELDFVRTYAENNPQYVWTYLDGKNYPLVCEGYHLVNRIGYFLTVKPAKPDTHYVIHLP
jgi:hypothetical protein